MQKKSVNHRMKYFDIPALILFITVFYVAFYINKINEDNENLKNVILKQNELINVQKEYIEEHYKILNAPSPVHEGFWFDQGAPKRYERPL
tara:strand:- start:1092 stop:1364 length:273 start_codon:yes stop_codon:yes gene_type:complete